MKVDKHTCDEIIKAAIAAPSGDNCQPFYFRVHENQIDIFLDAPRAEAYLDVDGFATWITLGATIENMVLTANQKGFSATIQLSSRYSDGTAVCALLLEPSVPHHDALVDAIYSRSTNRRLYDGTPLTPEFKTALFADISHTPEIDLNLVEDTHAIKKISRSQAEFDALVIAHTDIHAGLYRWLRWTPEETEQTRDGLPLGSLEIGVLDRLLFQLMRSNRVWRALRFIGAWRAVPQITSKIYMTSSAIGLISVDQLSPESYVRAGRALQRLWLRCALHNVSFQPLTGFVFLDLRQRLKGKPSMSKMEVEMLDKFTAQITPDFPSFVKRCPVMLFRLGTSAPPSVRTPRRRPQDVTS